MTHPRPFVWISDEVRRIARTYRVPEEILASIRGDKKRLAKAYRAAFDRQYFDLVAAKGEVELLGRVTTFSITPRDDDVIIALNFPTTRVLYFVRRDEFMKRDEDEWYKRLTDWIWVKARLVKPRKEKAKSFWKAERIAFAKVEEDRESWRHLVERYRAARVKPARFAALVALLGYNPTKIFGEPAAELLLLARVLPLVSPEPIHVFELSRPGTGKTSVALRYRLALRWLYFNEPPTPPSIAGDARTGRSPVAGAGGVWFDEVDKWPHRRTKLERINEAIEILLTAMEQGLWRRGAGGEKQIEVYNAIPLYFSGNVDVAAEPRERLKAIIAEASGSAAAQAFNERIAVAVAVVKAVDDLIQRAVLPVVGRAAALRGAVADLRDEYYRVTVKCETEYRGRFAKHHQRVARALKVLFEADDEQVCELARNLVAGVTA